MLKAVERLGLPYSLAIHWTGGLKERVWGFKTDLALQCCHKGSDVRLLEKISSPDMLSRTLRQTTTSNDGGNNCVIA